MVFMARVADQAERYKDMVDFLEAVIDAKDEDLNTEERISSLLDSRTT